LESQIIINIRIRPNTNMNISRKIEKKYYQQMKQSINMWNKKLLKMPEQCRYCRISWIWFPHSGPLTWGMKIFLNSSWHYPFCLISQYIAAKWYYLQIELFYMLKEWEDIKIEIFNYISFKEDYLYKKKLCYSQIKDRFTPIENEAAEKGLFVKDLQL
jgi:hypothetical protein